MKKQGKKYLLTAGILLAAFVGWTVLVSLIDVRPIGPRGSSVGMSSLNGWFHALTGVHMWLYALTDWLGLVPIAVALGFAVLGIVQWIKRKSFLRVDADLFALGAFYIAVMAAYLFFEAVVINYRPIEIEGVLEVSYPSSTTLLAACVMSTAMMQIHARIRGRWLRRGVMGMMCAFSCFMVIGRLISGVHWVTDIVGGLLLSAALVLLYAAAAEFCKSRTFQKGDRV